MTMMSLFVILGAYVPVKMPAVFGLKDETYAHGGRRHVPEMVNTIDGKRT